MRSKYASPAAMRAALDQRLLEESRRAGRDPNWLRRRLAFARLLVRLSADAPDAWILKGGMAIEVRRPGLARSTRDIDLVLREGLVDDPADVEAIREVLVEALMDDPDRDGFVFRVGAGSRLNDDAYGRPAWRFPVETMLAGRQFANVRLDVVARPEEIVGIEKRELPDLLGFAGIPTRTILVTDLRQQYAEKLHALTRTYQSGESSRVKDLLDLVLLIEDGVSPDTWLVRTVEHVFAVRRTHRVPRQLGSPPISWQAIFAALADEVGLDITSYRTAHDMVAEHWQRARSAPEMDQ